MPRQLHSFAVHARLLRGHVARSRLLRSSALTCCIVLPLCALLLAFATPASADIRYLYDELGRLVRVIREDGEAGSYHYDAVGNILSITRESGVAQTTTVSSTSTSSVARGSTIVLTISGANLIGAGLFTSASGVTLQDVDKMPVGPDALGVSKGERTTCFPPLSRYVTPF